mmetsp:Transcript_29117/g.65996  ORF Transcript_29117/g.65996 Transcript_29117/m.65996 type:complete len:354 (-) Transcript_29117:174-1235(-)
MAMRFAPLLVLLAMAALTVAVPMRSKSRCLREFERWAQKHSKVYADAPTYRRRLEAFCISLKEVEQINSRPGITWTAALNQYSDMTWAEFKSAKLMAEQNCSATITTPVEELVKMGIVADEFDWRNQTCGETSCVSMVKNQGTCGSCWTFSTAAALESLHAIKTGKMVLLSEQQLVDCAADFKNHGCNGGLPSQAFEYVMYNGGLSKMEDYPYVCGDGHCNVTGGPCAFDPAGKPWSVGATVLKVANFTPGDEISMKTVVGSHNPISVAFEVVPDLRHYSSGVYSSTTCVGTPDKVNHAVLAVGYGTEGGVTYWTIKNSWGFGWGDNGYFKIQRGNNMCGISVCASFPITSDK